MSTTIGNYAAPAVGIVFTSPYISPKDCTVLVTKYGKIIADYSRSGVTAAVQINANLVNPINYKCPDDFTKLTFWVRY